MTLMQRTLTALPHYISWCITNKDVTRCTAQKHIYVVKKIIRETNSFEKDRIVDWLADQREIKESSTRSKYVLALRCVCDYLKDCGILDYNWARDLPVPKVEHKLPVVFTIAEVEALISCHLTRTYGHYPNPQEAEAMFNTIFSLLAKTGARIGEALNIKVGDIDWGEGIWKLDHSKTKKGRLIPIPPDDLLRMKEYISDKNPDECIFINPMTKSVFRVHQIERNFRLRVKKLGIKKACCVHTLRHSFITELLRQDVSVLKIANICGHENITVTQGYAKLLYEDLRDAILRHPMTMKNRNPYDIIKSIRDTIEKLHLKEDTRFFYELSEGNDGIRFSIFIR